MEENHLDNLILSQSASFKNKTNDEVIYDSTYAGFPVMLGIVALLHFAFQIFNDSSIVAAFAMVGNTPNDLMKEVFWAFVIFSLFDYQGIKDKVNNYFTAKLVGLVVFGFTVLTLSSISASLFGTDNIMYDAVPFIAGAALCQYISYSIYKREAFHYATCHFAKVAIACIAIFLSVTTNHAHGSSTYPSSVTPNQLHSYK